MRFKTMIALLATVLCLFAGTSTAQPLPKPPDKQTTRKPFVSRDNINPTLFVRIDDDDQD